MKRKRLYVGGFVVLAALGTGAVAAYLTIWNLAIFVLLPGLSVLLGIILILVGLVVRRQSRTKESPGLGRVSRGLLLAGIFFSLQVAYFPMALGLRDLEVSRAQTFIAALIPRLEAYEQQHGLYPASVDPVLRDDEALPRLLQLHGDFPLDYDNRQFYVQQGATYRFRFYLPDGFIGFRYEYCCGADGAWTVTD